MTRWGADESDSGSLTLVSGTASHAFSEVYFDYGSSSFGLPFYPDTNVLPDGPGVGGGFGVVPDNGSFGTAQTDPMVILTALATPGRNPADISIPVLVGSEASGSGSGGPDIRVASTQGNGSGTSGASGSGVLVTQVC